MATGKKTGGGSRKGIPNKDVAPIREKFNQLLEGYSIEMMLKDLKAIERPEERLKIIAGLAEFAIPKLARTEVKQETTVKAAGFFEIDGQRFDFGG
jgi:hypothetical protein